VLAEVDKISIVEPSIEAAKSEWARFQAMVYEETVKKLAGKALVLFAPSLVLTGIRTIRTRPDCLVLWGGKESC